MLPPRDYPEKKGTTESTGDGSDHVTLRSVRERVHSKEPVSDDMIQAAVSNLYTHEPIRDTRNTSSAKLVPEALRTLIQTVKRS